MRRLTHLTHIPASASAPHRDANLSDPVSGNRRIAALTLSATSIIAEAQDTGWYAGPCSSCGTACPLPERISPEEVPSPRCLRKPLRTPCRRISHGQGSGCPPPMHPRIPSLVCMNARTPFRVSLFDRNVPAYPRKAVAVVGRSLPACAAGSPEHPSDISAHLLGDKHPEPDPHGEYAQSDIYAVKAPPSLISGVALGHAPSDTGECRLP